MKQKLLLLLFSLLIGFAMTELTISLLVHKDTDDNMSLNYIHLKPYKLPVLETQKKITSLLEHQVSDTVNGTDVSHFENVRLVPDTLLGWAPSPCYKGDNGLYVYNKDAIRSETTDADYSDKAKTRIAIFGDSYSHGDEVPFENTIGYYLQKLFSGKDLDVEVINFGVSGYGIDQAYLRWKSVNEKFHPDIVLLGVQFENVKRHINILRPFYYFITEIPYSKPRFVINADSLVLISNPIHNIAETVDIIRDFGHWEFARYEGFYSEEDYTPNIFYYSKTVSFITSALSQIFDEIDFYTPGNESYEVTYKLINQFANDVNSEKEIFIPVHLPVKNDFDFATQTFIKTMYKQQFIYDKLFSALKDKMNFVEPYSALEDYGKRDGTEKLFMTRHYSKFANKIIAQEILDFIEKNYQDLLHNKREIE